MKVYLVSTYPPHNCGVGIYTSNLASQLKNHVDVSVIANKGESKGRETADGTGVVRCWRKNSFVYPFQIARSIREKPDVVHVMHEYLLYGSPAHAVFFPLVLLLLRLRGTPIITTMHSTIRREKLNADFYGRHGAGRTLVFLKKLLTILVTKLIGLLSSRIIVHSDPMKEILVSKYGIKETRIHVIPHGVELPDIVKKNVDSKNEKVVLTFGFVKPDKGIDHLVRAFRLALRDCPDVRLLIIGEAAPTSIDQNYAARIRKLIDLLGLAKQIDFRGQFIASEELQRQILGANAIVFCGVDNGVVGSSGALASCAALGKPVIATEIPKFACQLDNRVSGILVRPGDERSLARAIVELLEEEQLSRRLGENLRSSLSDRTWDKVALATLMIYNEMKTSL